MLHEDVTDRVIAAAINVHSGLSAKPVGLLINVNVPHLSQGLRRVTYEDALKRSQG